MKFKYFPCKQCISYASCKSKLYNECSILYNSLDNAMYPTNDKMRIVARANRAKAQQMVGFLGYDRFVIYKGRVFMFRSLGLTENEEREVISFLERNYLHGVF